MGDREFLLWLADRLVSEYGEDRDVDFVGKLTSIAEATPAARVTPNMGSRAHPARAH